MASYNFKAITPIPTSDDFVNIIQSKTQRKTPTQVHPNYKIQRIRGFYIRKVKFCASMATEKLDKLLQDFPKLEELHPFFADLINILYDRDHYKIALGQVNNLKNIIENIAKDYIKLQKYGDSAYRCKMLKRAAMGRMCTSLKKMKNSFTYLEEVRQHLGRQPSIDPYARTILIAGFPNVGKSSFINNITNANVEVQPFPFTTQALYVGHTDYANVRWQIIDSPGIQDYDLESRNTIEMQSITAMAHLKACVLFFMDLSETCGYSLQTQMNLFEGIKPLFNNKSHLLILTKSDLKKPEQLNSDVKADLENFITKNSQDHVLLSNKEGNTVFDVKKKACEILQKYRMDNEEKNINKNAVLKREEDYLKGVKVYKPTYKRDNKDRPATVPQDILDGKKHVLGRPSLKQMQEEHGGAGVFEFPQNEHFLLENQDWKYDVVPEILDGKNIADFIDPEIEAKLKALEDEEEALLAEEGLKMEDDEMPELTEEQADAYKDYKQKVDEIRVKSRLKRPNNTILKTQDGKGLKAKLEDMGKNPATVLKKQRDERKKKTTLKQMLDYEKEESKNAMDMEDTIDTTNRSRTRSRSRALSKSQVRDISRHRTPQKFDDASQKIKRVVEKKKINRQGMIGEADRRVIDTMPKHQYAGKMDYKRDRR